MPVTGKSPCFPRLSLVFPLRFRAFSSGLCYFQKQVFCSSFPTPYIAFQHKQDKEAAVCQKQTAASIWNIILDIVVKYQFSTFLQNCIKIWATCARVALP